MRPALSVRSTIVQNCRRWAVCTATYALAFMRFPCDYHRVSFTLPIERTGKTSIFPPLQLCEVVLTKTGTCVIGAIKPMKRADSSTIQSRQRILCVNRRRDNRRRRFAFSLTGRLPYTVALAFAEPIWNIPQGRWVGHSPQAPDQHNEERIALYPCCAQASETYLP